MTESKGPMLDGFGHDVTEDSGGTAVLYGAGPFPGTAPWAPEPPFFEPPKTAPPIPPVIPPLVISRPQGYTLTVTGPDGTVMTLALSAEEWAKVRAAILEAMR